VLTIFFATSFTTALQRAFLRAWRRPPGLKRGAYMRGPVWLLVMLANMAVLGTLRGLLDNGLGLGIFAVLSLTVTSCTWWFTAWFLLLGDVRWRVLLPTALITSVTVSGFAVSAVIWMPNVVTRNESQFGFFGVALSLVTWFSGAAICVLLGACAGPVFAEDDGPIGRLIRGRRNDLLEPRAMPSLPPPATPLTLRNAFRSQDEGG
jgi:membrane protein